MIQPWDASLLKTIEKAIQSSDLGINPQNDGRVIRLAFPQLTEERRKELTKQVKKYGESGKVAIRNTSVATVSGDGTVTHVGKGNTTLTCTVDGQTLTCIVRGN